MRELGFKFLISKVNLKTCHSQKASSCFSVLLKAITDTRGKRDNRVRMSVIRKGMTKSNTLFCVVFMIEIKRKDTKWRLDIRKDSCVLV